MKKFINVLVVILRLSACYALFNEEFGFSAIWFASAEILKLFNRV